MAPIGGAPLQWALVGLRTGAEAYGALPPPAAGRIAEYLNQMGNVLALTRASTEDVQDGAEVPELLVPVDHVTYVQPWGTAEAPAMPASTYVPRGMAPMEVSLVLTTRITIAGPVYLLRDMDLSGVLRRSTELFLEFGRATLTTPTGEGRAADGLLVNKHHILLARRMDQPPRP
ncbi:MAG: hypothetical protein HY690_02840 [Chloroflexi bacterium]|nr:hypothetical protein [Chloroflexota bacterium]